MWKRQQIPPVKLIKTFHITDELLPKKLVEIGGSKPPPPPFKEESANFTQKRFHLIMMKMVLKMEFLDC